jgi:hypothetical protein
MGRGLFDLIAAYNGGQGQGYAPFNPGFQSAEIGPQQAIAMQARGNLMSQPGAGPSLIGNVAGGFLGGGIRAGINKYKASRPEAKLQAAMSQELDVALNERMAKMMKANPSLDARHARVAAAEELFAWTARSKQSPQLVDMARQKAMMAMQEMGEFDPEAQEKYAKARKDNAEVDNQGTKMVNVMDKGTGVVHSLTEAAARNAIQANPNLLQISDVPLSSLQDRREVLRGTMEDTEQYNPATGQYDKIGSGPASLGKGRTSVNVDMGEDASTESDLSKRENDYMSSFAGMKAINHAIDQISVISQNAEAKGIQGTTGTVGNIYKFLGEATSVVSGGAGIAREITKQNGGDSKVYANGSMTYDELVDPSKYDSVFENLQMGGQESKRVKAAMINLAYMLAITEESSARAISDNDIKLRLQTLGADISSGKSMRTVLEDRRRNAMYNLKARLDVDKTFKDDPHYRGIYADMAKQYNLQDDVLLPKQPRRPTGGAPETTINPDGTITVRNKK